MSKAIEPQVQAWLDDRYSGAQAAACAAVLRAADAALLEPARALHLQNLLLGQEDLAAAATVFAGELASGNGYDRVAVGMLDQGRVDVLALSHSAEHKPQQELLRAIAAAMEEAIDQRATLRYPAPPDEVPLVILAHAELAKRSGCRICTIPLLSEGEAIGALCIELSGVLPQSLELARLEHFACLIAPVLVLRQRAEQPWIARARQALGRAIVRLGRRDDPWPKLAAGLAVAAAAGLSLLPMTYRVGAPARVEGAVQRIVAAPNEGFLRSAMVRPGDAVKAGDLLAELDGQDLLLEKRKWEGELAQHENSYSAALARSDRAQFVISHAKATEARAQLELVRQQIDRARLVAPIDGIVIKGDLSQSLGAPVRRGEALLTLAPAGRYRLIIDVDERDIAEVRQGQSGALALSAMPGDAIPFVVERVTPVATSNDGRNGFEVEARLAAADGVLRPGLQGVAKIAIDERAGLWVIGHRIIDWLRLLVWRWGA